MGDQNVAGRSRLAERHRLAAVPQSDAEIAGADRRGLAVAWLGLDRLALYFVNVQPSWLATLIAWLIGLGLLAGVVFLAAPVTSLVASLFFDEIAGHVERAIDPAGAPGRPAPLSRRRSPRCALPG